ncbi:hypothetical protein F2Q68_00037808 [Brassica cretica]|uniref:Beta-ketoacyl-[acyl-carrier-protein] synthase III C-terminal domain-containing protein n=2 Tax=Brassica cretica TaxID=69181 RepID=A0ABQ7E9A5_BRACR|nr:hypothetical protein F2Q68_00037808 [Brassica cretica]KAF3593607.1 hypothetical protein DY000_02027881 [Brassica cretica]
MDEIKKAAVIHFQWKHETMAGHCYEPIQDTDCRPPVIYKPIYGAAYEPNSRHPEAKSRHCPFARAVAGFPDAFHTGPKAQNMEITYFKNVQGASVDAEASRSTLHRFGNTSSSSIWFELAYIEAKGRMKKGNKFWQIALGSGFNCNSAVWVAGST